MALHAILLNQRSNVRGVSDLPILGASQLDERRDADRKKTGCHAPSRHECDAFHRTYQELNVSE
jgi:hypothetical protein